MTFSKRPLNDIPKHEHDETADAKRVLQVNSSGNEITSNSNELIFSSTGDIVDGAEIDSGVFDTSDYSSITVRIKGFQGANQRVTSSTNLTQDEGVLQSNTAIPETLLLQFFTIAPRGRYFRIQAQNNTGSTITDGYLEITGAKGGTPPASTFPLAVSPTSFSPAALTQSVTIGQQPDGDYTNLPTDGEAFNTTSNLSADATYTSDWVDTDGWNTIDLVIAADVESAQQGINIDYTDDVQAGTPTTILTKKFAFRDNDLARGFIILRLAPELDGFRVRYVNGSTGQSSFYLSATLRTASELGRMNTANVPVVGDFLTEVALGNIDNYQTGTKFGRNPDIDTASTPEDLWNGGSNYTGFPTGSPETVQVFSSSGNDTSAGTGARTIRFIGLKSNTSTEYESEDVTMNGTTAVTTSTTWYRINRAYVLTAGSGGENAGTITIRHSSTTANVFIQMPVGYNQTTIGAYTVPAGKKLIIKRLRVSITRANGSAGSATITFRGREPSGVFRALRAFELQTGAATEFTSVGGDVIVAGTDLKFRIENVSDNNTVCDGAFEYLLLDTLA